METIVTQIIFKNNVKRKIIYAQCIVYVLLFVYKPSISAFKSAWLCR